MYIAIDIGGTTTRVASAEHLDDASFITIRKYPTVEDYNKNFDLLIQTIYEVANGALVQGVGCGIAGPVSEDQRTIAKSPNLPGWGGKMLAQNLEDTLSCRTVMANDAVVAALGEAYYGYAKGKNFIYLIWGTGFGGTRITMVDGKPLPAGFEAGHQILDWHSDRICGCGQLGCAEAFVGGRNIQRHYGKQVRNLTETEWQEIYEKMAQSILNIVSLHHPSLIMMGSGIALNQKPRVEAIAHMVEARLRIYEMPEIRVTDLADNTGIYGALGLLH